MPYAIRNKRTKKYVFGTDYRYNPRHQRTDPDIGLIFRTEQDAMLEMRIRGCGKQYEVVAVRIDDLE